MTPAGAHFLTFAAKRMSRPFSHLSTNHPLDPISRRPFPHPKPPTLSLEAPISSRESAHFLTYPAHFLTFCRVSI